MITLIRTLAVVMLGTTVLASGPAMAWSGSNGTYLNGTFLNGIGKNGLSRNGVGENGAMNGWTNGFANGWGANGTFLNGLTTNSPNGPADGHALRVIGIELPR